MFILDCEQTDDSFLKVTESAFRHLGLSGDAIVELVFVSEEEIKQLNAQTRGIDKVTDVLSYSISRITLMIMIMRLKALG